MAPARRRGRLLPVALAGAASLAVAGLCAFQLLPARGLLRAPRSPGAGAPLTRRAAPAGAGAEGQEGIKGWQKGLDTAFLDVDASLEERLQGLRQIWSSAGEVSSAVQEAARAVADKGLGEAQPEALDALFPTGTLARSDVEGVLAFARQAPELLSSVRAGGAPASSMRAPDLEQVGKIFGRLLSPEGLAEAADEARNVLRSTPKGLEEPPFEVTASGEGFEVRRYEKFTVASRKMSAKGGGDTMASSAEGFNTLAGYLFGDNKEERSMKMTMPVEIDYSDSEPGAQTMSFVMPAEDAAQRGLPTPNDPSVQIKELPQRLVAVHRFPGVATMEEVKRQVEKLRAALELDGSYAPVSAGEYSVLQYNPPYTLPWRRRNEVAMVVTPVSGGVATKRVQ